MVGVVKVLELFTAVTTSSASFNLAGWHFSALASGKDASVLTEELQVAHNPIYQVLVLLGIAYTGIAGFRRAFSAIKVSV